MLLGTLGAILLGNLSPGKGIVRPGSGSKKGKGIGRARYGKKIGFLMPPHTLSIIKMNQDLIEFFQEIICLKNKNCGIRNEPLWYADVGTHWIALLCNKNEIVYFDSFGVEHIPEEIKEFIGNKNIKANIFQGQANNSVTCGYLCIRFIVFVLAGKKMADFTSLFSPYHFKRTTR